MNAYEFNKLAGAVLAALLVIFGTRTLMHEFYHDEPLEQKGFKVDVSALVSSSETHATPEAEPEGDPIAALLASADPAAGAKLFKKCRSCHTKKEGGANRIGPNLWNVVGRDVASVGGYAYSKALKARNGGWSYEFLNCFLKKPKKCVTGTKMGFSGLKKPKARADMIAYLRSLSANPAPLPQ